ncbi:hypothetical protein [Maricaulis sp.]|uniref:alpha-glutamyl/putrescinyl thymine pyrophosphorylase clade 3 protein n=1 Tax=Maricaulis sp. TaxID=1486257 RepID=UPI003A93E436
MRIKNQELFDKITENLITFDTDAHSLVGIQDGERRTVFILQLVDSVRRIQFLNALYVRSKSPRLHTPYSGAFDPYGGAAVLHKAGRSDDAFWLIYLATHFGKHKDDGWNLTEDFYGRFGQGGIWDWANASPNPNAIEQWIAGIYPHITSAGRSRRFGNHRKFETLKPGPRGTGHACKTYIEWIAQYGSHTNLVWTAQQTVGQNPTDVYAYLYKDLDSVAKMGRLGKFDFLCNLSNLMIAPILPDRAYIQGSTGPSDGARLLFGNHLTLAYLDRACTALAEHLRVSPQVIEDSLCNWQKSPTVYNYFRG